MGQWQPDGVNGLPVYVMSLEAATHTFPAGRPQSGRSDDGVDSWQRLACGLPKNESFLTGWSIQVDVPRRGRIMMGEPGIASHCMRPPEVSDADLQEDRCVGEEI